MFRWEKYSGYDYGDPMIIPLYMVYFYGYDGYTVIQLWHDMIYVLHITYPRIIVAFISKIV